MAAAVERFKQESMFAWSLYGFFSVPLGQFTSVTYPRLTSSLGSRDPKNALAARNNEAKGLGKVNVWTVHRLWRGGGSIDCSPGALPLSCGRLVGAYPTKTRKCWFG